MPCRLALVLLLARSAAAGETAAPVSAAPRDLALPSPTQAFARGIEGMASWLRTADGLRTAIGVDAELALLGGLSPDAQSKAVEPIEKALSPETAAQLADWGALTPDERLTALRKLSQARKAAAPSAVKILRGKIQEAAERGADLDELENLRKEADGWRVFGGEGAAALTELGDLVYRRRLAPREEEVRSFAKGASPEELPAGKEPARAEFLAPAGQQAPAPKPAPPAPKKSDLKVRALTAALLVPSIIGFIHLGGAAFVLFTAALAGLSLREYAGMLKAGSRPVQPVIAIASAVALALTVALHGPIAAAIAGVVIVSAARELFRKDHSFERAAYTVFGALLFGFLPAHLALVRGLSPFGEHLTVMLFASAWLSDTTAYFFGRRWGSHKIAPMISPKKTWEGALAGFVGAMAAVLGIWATAPAMMPFWTALGVGLIMGIVGQASGYLNSMIKRANGVKDSGRLLPGHGGVIDRFDTFVLSSTFVYYLLSLI